MNNVLFLVRTAPYGTASSGEAYRAIIGLSGMGVETTVILMCDGVFNALKGQKPEKIEMHSIEKAFATLKDFDVTLYIHDKSVEERALSKGDFLEAEFIDTARLKELLNSKECVISFS